MTLSELLIDPFVNYAFMRRALAACVVLSMGGAPLGLFMTLRRMTLAGDAMSHAILPGVAVAFLAAGLSVWPMTLGGLIAGMIVATLAALLTRTTRLKEDAAFTLLYLLSLALGVTLISMKGNNVDLVHLLFGNILAVRQESLWLITASTCITLFAIAVIYRRLVIDCFDPDFMKAATAHQAPGGRKGGIWTRQIFFVLLMINLIAAFQALGTLMALGIMILPVIAARFWAERLEATMLIGIAVAVASSVAGLLISYHVRIPAGPAVVLVSGLCAVLSALMGRSGSLRAYVTERG